MRGTAGDHQLIKKRSQGEIVIIMFLNVLRRLWRMAPSSIDASIVVGEKPGVAVEEIAVGKLPATLSIPPISVSIYVVPVGGAAGM